MKRLLEVCCGSLADAIHAVKGGAERIELCSALSVDGLTPSLGLTEAVRRLFPQLTIHVLIRPREGNFVYTKEEKAVILSDIKHAIDAGADGIVCGALTTEGDIDIPFVTRMIQTCGDHPFTFHRAFDVCRDPLQALLSLKALGVRRILTSGQQPSAVAGIPLLKQLIDAADGTPIVMPGGGVSSENVQMLLQATGTNEVHGSCRHGATTTDPEEVMRILKLMNC